MPGKDLFIASAAEVESALSGREKDVLAAVRKAYETHAIGASSLPHSSFLRFPDSDKDRIICLPAYLGGDYALAGVKWISSVPDNLNRGMERASAVMILNDRRTGRPEAVLEGSIISKQRTAASAALASHVLAPCSPETIGFVGCGPINISIARFLATVWPEVRRYVVFDIDPARAGVFSEELLARDSAIELNVAPSLHALLEDSEMVSFATTAIKPHVESLEASPDNATILHVSLRDLSASAITASHNIVDDLDHVNRAETSIHLASRARGHSGFVHGSLGDILTGKIGLPERDGRKVVFSPFGLGLLDLAVADLVRESLLADGMGTRIPSFLP